MIEQSRKLEEEIKKTENEIKGMVKRYKNHQSEISKAEVTLKNYHED